MIPAESVPMEDKAGPWDPGDHYTGYLEPFAGVLGMMDGFDLSPWEV